MSGTLELGYDYSNNITRAVSVDATGKLEVVSSGVEAVMLLPLTKCYN